MRLLMEFTAVKLAFLLQATDNMSRVLDNISKGSLSSFVQATAKLGKNTMEIGGQMTAMGDRVFSSMLSVVQSASGYGDSAYKIAQKVGMGIESWQELSYVANMAGVENEQLAAGLAKFNKTIVAAANGNKTAAQVFGDLGISLQDAAGKMRAPQAILADVADVFSSVEDGAGVLYIGFLRQLYLP
jgi:hypothetical protein